MDEYKEYLYKRDPDRYARVSAGDLSYQFYVKDRQQCKPFKYFLDVVAPDMKERYPLEEPPEYASGAVSFAILIISNSYTMLMRKVLEQYKLHNFPLQIQSMADKKFCIDKMNRPKEQPLGILIKLIAIPKTFFNYFF